jgi:hypothetical protein
LRSLALVAAFVFLTGCALTPAGGGTPSPSPSAEAGNGSATNVPQDLTFVGKLPARWTKADVTCGTADGKGADSFSVKLTALDAQGQKDTLTVVVPSGYKGAGEYSVNATATLTNATGGAVIASSTPVLQTLFAVNLDLGSGTVDANLAQGADQQDAVEHVQGSWRCK